MWKTSSASPLKGCVLHASDLPCGIFAKAWGKPVADAFFYLETHHHPALRMPAS